MPHITEGLLHAHLDGALGPDEQLEWAKAEAHFKVCGDCRRRLDEAAELREAARALLAGATPVRPAGRPAFDELVTRARGVDAATGRKPSTRVGGAWWRTPATLGWAASLVIAAGAGWIGRQVVVERGLDVPPTAAETDVMVGRADADEGAGLDDIDEDATPEESRARRDAAPAPAAPEAAARFRAEGKALPGQGARPEAEELQRKAEPRANAEPGEDADAGAEADAIRLQDVAPLTAAAEGTSGARCYAASPAPGDGPRAAAGNPETLRLAPDGTVTLRLEGRPMVGFWQRARADSLHLRVTDGEQWRDLTLIEAEDGVRGDAELDAVACP